MTVWPSLQGEVRRRAAPAAEPVRHSIQAMLTQEAPVRKRRSAAQPEQERVVWTDEYQRSREAESNKLIILDQDMKTNHTSRFWKALSCLFPNTPPNTVKSSLLNWMQKGDDKMMDSQFKDRSGHVATYCTQHLSSNKLELL